MENPPQKVTAQVIRQMSPDHLLSFGVWAWDYYGTTTDKTNEGALDGISWFYHGTLYLNIIVLAYFLVNAESV